MVINPAQKAEMESISLFISSAERKENFSSLYIPQKVHWFQGQFRVNLTSRELLPPSLGGRYIPVSN
jgi:hypothetical protein